MFRNRLLQCIELQANYLQVSISWYSHVNAVKDTFKFCLQEDETAWSSRHPERWSSKVQNGVWLLENQKCETDSETCFLGICLHILLWFYVFVCLPLSWDPLDGRSVPACGSFVVPMIRRHYEFYDGQQTLEQHLGCHTILTHPIDLEGFKYI